MKNLVYLFSFLAIISTGAFANISAFSSIDGSAATGLFLPLGDSELYLGVGGTATMTDGDFKVNGWVGVDGLPIMGGMELDLNIADNELSSISLGKSFTYPLTEKVSIGFAIYVLDITLAAPNTITLMPYIFPFISADLEF